MNDQAQTMDAWSVDQELAAGAQIDYVLAQQQAAAAAAAQGASPVSAYLDTAGPALAALQVAQGRAQTAYQAALAAGKRGNR